MTRKRNDGHSTEFGLWLREQPELDSRRHCFVATNIDYLWSNYKTGEWMLIEEKRYKRKPTRSQSDLFKLLHTAAKHDPQYCGFHVIIFENTSPDDGAIWVDEYEVSKDELMQFLQFRWAF